METSGTLESVGEAIAAEESIGTWTDIKTIKVDIQRRLLREAANASTTSSEEGDTQRNTIKVRTLSKDPKSILSI